jgi:metal-sulfur cluster biosynthetic enzyme
VTEDAVRAALDEVIDPCSAAAGAAAGIAELGLVRELRIEPGEAGAVVRVVLRVTDPGCLMGGPFAASARRRLAALPGVAEVDVRLDEAFDWTPADAAAAYRERLERARARRWAALGAAAPPPPAS